LNKNGRNFDLGGKRISLGHKMASSQKLTSYKFTGILLQDVKTDSGPTGVFYDFMQGDTSLVPQSAMSRIIA